MKIETLRLNGVLRFGVPIELDFRSLPPGLIAIVGENGAGKTTVLEAMLAAFYRELPTRGKAIHYATEKNSFIEVVASFDGGRRLRARLNMDGVTGDSDAVLIDLATGVALNDGKVSTFDPVIERELPPLSVLKASAYAAQDRSGSFSSADKKGRRELFAYLLGLAQFEAFASTSRQAALTVERRLGELRALLLRLNAETGAPIQAAMDAEGEALAHRATGGRAMFDSVTALVTERERRRTGAAVTAAAHTRAQEAYSQARTRQDQLKVDLRTIETEAVESTRSFERRRREREAAVQSVIDRESGRLGAMPSEASIADTLTTSLHRLAVTFEAARDLRLTRIANNQDLIDRAENIRRAVDEVAALERQVAGFEADVARLGMQYTTSHDALTRLKIEQANLSSTERDLTTAQSAAALLERVPFGGKCVDAGCELVQSAKASQDLIPALEAQQQRQRDLAAEIADTTAALATLEQRCEAERRQINIARGQIVPLQAVADLLERLNAAENRVTELQAEIVQLERQHAADQARAHADASASIKAIAAQIEASATAVQQAKETAAELTDKLAIDEANAEAGFRTRRDPIDAELATVSRALLDASADMQRMAPAQAALTRIDEELTDARARVSRETVTAARLEAETEAFEQRRAEFARRLSERAHLATATQSLEQELVEWQALARIFGPEGLPVLEIDAAGPGVSALANDLLSACFGGRFTVELVTQEAKAKGGGFKEVFELKVFDGERGGEARDLNDLSGGEKVLVEEALKSAISLFVNQRNVQPIRTAWRDETTGALDPDNAQRYLAMLRRVHARGGLHHLFFVSHNPEVSAQADAQIVVAGGTARIVLPPFYAAA